MIYNYILTLKTAEVKKKGSKTKTKPDKIICEFSSATGSIFHAIREHPRELNKHFNKHFL